MIRKEIVIAGGEGLPARSAALLVQIACKFAARVLIEQGSKVINAKSMMGVLSLGIGGDDPLYVVTDGEDEQAAVDAIVQLVDAHFVQEV
ncbi:MAG TPA: HPr family phosphocarrier protein [Clostridia bacterium]|nr:HPr family phosphocarrier protein [Clostridia bacterium]